VGLESAVITVESPKGPVTRTLHFVWPEGGDFGEQFPLVLGFHEEVELGQTGEQEVAKVWAESMVGAPIVGVFPEGRVDGTGSLFVGWDAWTPMSEKQDVFVVLGILSLMGNHATVDPDKIYAFGRSGGAAFVGNRLATQPCATEIDGFGMFGFPLVDFQFGELAWFEEDAPPRPVVIVHGTNDQYVSHTGGTFMPMGFLNTWVSFLSVEQTFQAWALRNGCTTSTSFPSEKFEKFIGGGDECAATTIRFDVLGQGHDFDLDWYQSADGNSSANELMVLLGELGL
jgi:poly(3-hydroxybutyrate) depolymerase